jgi:group I intron endonuclease
MSFGIIYKATFPNNKIYIGQTICDFYKRIRKHLNAAFRSNSNEYNTKIARAIRKYARYVIVWEIIYQNVDIEKLNDLEIQTIKIFNSRINGYNSTDGGDGCIGYIHNKKNKKKMSIIRKNKFKNGEISINGEENPAHVLNWNIVKEIRQKYCTGKYTQKELGKEFGVDRKTITYVIKNETWFDENYIPKDFNHLCKLNKEIVEEIRILYKTDKFSLSELAEKYGVCFQNISNIINYKTWRNK